MMMVSNYKQLCKAFGYDLKEALKKRNIEMVEDGVGFKLKAPMVVMMDPRFDYTFDQEAMVLWLLMYDYCLVCGYNTLELDEYCKEHDVSDDMKKEMEKMIKYPHSRILEWG